MESIPQGAEFLNKNPQYDIIIRTIHPPNIRQILKEYPGLLPFKKMKIEEEYNIISISIVSRKIYRQGYPKLRVYLVDKGTKEEIKDLKNRILRIIVSG